MSTPSTSTPIMPASATTSAPIGAFAELRAVYEAQGDVNKIKVLDALNHFLKKKDIKVEDQIPKIDGKVIDLCSLYHQTQLKQGSDVVTEKNKWAEIAQILGYANPRGRGIDVLLQRVYYQILRSFEQHIWMSKYQKLNRPDVSNTNAVPPSTTTSAMPLMNPTTTAPIASSNNAVASNSLQYPANKRPRPNPSALPNTSSTSNQSNKSNGFGDNDIRSAISSLNSNQPSIVINALNILTQKSFESELNVLNVEKYPNIIISLGELLKVLNPLGNILQYRMLHQYTITANDPTPSNDILQVYSHLFYASRLLSTSNTNNSSSSSNLTSWQFDNLITPLIPIPNDKENGGDSGGSDAQAKIILVRK